MARLATLHVCTSCREPGSVRGLEHDRPGFKLYQALHSAFASSQIKHQVEVLPAECLSLCPRPCGVALSSPGAWHYLFGEQDPLNDAGDIIALVTQYLESEEGSMPRKQRPKSLQKSILGRIPPNKTYP